MRDDARTPVPPAPRGHHPLNALTDRFARLFTITPEDRENTVTAMLADTRGSAAGYWLQLGTALGIATLGLVLDSTAVVIGAMLVAPLMTPIIALGMGFAVGSPLLVLRSAVRIAASVVVVPLCAAAMTLLLPLHEITSEISARTSPTVLDLAVACFCAIAGVYAASRHSSERSSTAAGTAIGIALVPPLCVVGYGIGTRSAAILSGAALLFVANFSAIVFLSLIGFSILGYGRVPVRALEKRHTESTEARSFTGRLVRRFSVFFSSKAGVAVRILMPLALVVVVYVPLSQALSRVKTEIRLRAAVNEELASIADGTVHSSVRIDADEVNVHVVAIDQGGNITGLKERLLARIEKIAPDTHATVAIETVADARALERRESDAARRSPPPPPPPAPTKPPLASLRDPVEQVLASWPAAQVGALSSWRIVFVERALVADAGPSASVTIEVVHLGAPLGPAAEAVLNQSLSRALAAPVTLHDVALATEPIVAPLERPSGWLIDVATAFEKGRQTELFACIGVPDGARAESVVRTISTSPILTSDRVRVESGHPDWSFHWSITPCASAADAGDAGP